MDSTLEKGITGLIVAGGKMSLEGALMVILTAVIWALVFLEVIETG